MQGAPPLRAESPLGQRMPRPAKQAPPHEGLSQGLGAALELDMEELLAGGDVAQRKQRGGPLSRKLAAICVYIHTTVVAMAERVSNEQQRRVYVTPKLFLDLIHTYIHVLHGKHTTVLSQRQRLENGLQLLASACGGWGKWGHVRG